MPHLERGKVAMAWGEGRGSMTMSAEAGPMTCVGGREGGREEREELEGYIPITNELQQ